MDLLASYDDGENSENTATSEKKEKSSSPEPNASVSAATLAEEMETFERMMSGGSPDSFIASIPLPVPPPVSHIPLPGAVCPADKTEEEHKDTSPHAPKDDDDCSSSHSGSRSPSSKSNSRSPSRSSSSDEDEDDASSARKASSAHSSPTHSSPVHSDGLAPSKASSVKKAVSRSRSRSKSAGRKRPSNSPSRSRRRPSSDHSRRRHPHGSSGRHRHRGGRSRRRHASGDRPHKRHSRSRSRDRHRRRHRRRRSRSKSGRSPHHRHSRSPHGKGGKPRRRSRSRSRSSHRRKSRSPDKRCHMQSMEPRKKPLTYKEQLRQQLIKASKILSGQGPDGSMGAGLVGMMEKPSNLPLNSGGAFGDGASGSATVTPQMALYQTMAAMHQKAQELTGIAVPKYYNPAAVNPLKYAEQVQKRKLLWSKNKDKKDEPGQWQSSTFLPDQDGKQTAKFRKLMGMKEDMVDDANKDAMTTETVRKQEELFQRLDKEYEFARMATHTHRGVGLGFQSHSYQH